MPEPLVVQLANDFRQRLAGADASLTQEMGRRWLAVEERLWADMLRLAEAMAAEKEAGRAISQSKLFRFERYQTLLIQLEDELRRFNVTAERAIERTALANAIDGLDDGLALIDGAVRPFGERGVRLAFDRLGIEAAENVAALARAGKPLNVILARSYPAAVQAITDRLIDGIARGINPREVARRMRNDGLSQGLNHILLVARDQANRAYRTATLEQYKASGVVRGYRRLSAKQARTCAACLALDGIFYPLDEPFIEHPQGRCTAIPAVEGFEPVQTKSGAEWFHQQDEAIQREILGAGRFEAWQDGLFDFLDVAKVVPNDIWGPSAQVKSLAELTGGRRGTAKQKPKPPAPTPPTGSGAAARRLIGEIEERTITGISRLENEIAEYGKLIDGARNADDYESMSRLMKNRADRIGEITALKGSFIDRIRQDVLYVDKPAKFDHKFVTRFTGERRENTLQGLNEFSKLVGRDSLKGKTVGIKGGGKGRAYYDNNGNIALTTHSGVRTVIHELGHWLEHQDAEVHQKALEFLDRRTAGEPLEWLGRGYSRREVARKDKFMSAYMGKEYKLGDDRYATEIVSMGLEYMWHAPGMFAREDPDYFDFIYGLMRGQ